MDSYLLINIIFILVLFIYAYFDKYMHKSSSKIFITILIVIFSIIMAFRPIDTPDTAGYIDGFYLIQPKVDYNISYLEEYNNYEKGYIQLIQLFKYFSTNYKLFFFIIAFLGTYISIRAQFYLYQNLNPNVRIKYGLILAIYIALFGVLYNGISVRAGLSMGMGLMFIAEWVNKKRIKATLCILIAFAIQRTCIIMVVIWLIYLLIPSFKKKIYLLIWGVLGAILFLSDVSGFSAALANNINLLLLSTNINDYSSYLEEISSEKGLPFYFFWLVSGFLILIGDNSKIYNKYINIILAGVFIFCIFGGVRAIARVYDMFFLFLVPLLTYHLDKNTKYLNSMVIQRLKITKVGLLLVICFASYIMLKNSFKWGIM